MTRMGLITVLAAAATTLVLAAPVAARPGLENELTAATVTAGAGTMTGSGTGTIDIRAITTLAVFNGFVVQKRDLTGELTGALDGTFTEEVTGVIAPNGNVTFFGKLVFTGTVEGCGEGTVTGLVFGKAVSGVPTAEASVTVIPGLSTVPVRGTATIEQVGTALTYQVTYHCV